MRLNRSPASSPSRDYLIQVAPGVSVPRALRSRPSGMRLFYLLPYLVPCVGALYALATVALVRRRAVRAVWVAWLLGPVALTIALATWTALWLTPGIIPFHRWLLCFSLTLAAPAAVAGLAATVLAVMGFATTRLPRWGLALHFLVTLAIFAIAYPLGAVASARVVDLLITVQ